MRHHLLVTCAGDRFPFDRQLPRQRDFDQADRVEHLARVPATIQRPVRVTRTSWPYCNTAEKLVGSLLDPDPGTVLPTNLLGAIFTSTRPS
jgi:hypothetical protein